MNNMMNPMAGFIQGSQLASQQANDGLGQQRQRDEQAMRAIQMIGSISLGAKGGNIDGPVDPQKFEQGLNLLQQNGVNVSAYRGRPEVADVAARASMTALQQIQGGMAAQQAALQLQSTLVGIQQRQQSIELQARRDTRDEARAQRQETMAGVPAGYQRTPTGLAPIPGGPADPAQQAAAAAATRRPDERASDFNREIDKKDAQRVVEMGGEATAAQGVIDRVTQLRSLRQQAVTGRVAGPLAGVIGNTPAAGLVPGSREAAALDGIAGGITLELAGQMKGALSDKDLAFLQRQAPTSNVTNDVAEAMHRALEAAAKRKIDMASFYRTWAERNGNARGADQAWRKFVTENELFKPDSKAIGGFVINDGADWSKYITAAQPAARAPAGGTQTPAPAAAPEAAPAAPTRAPGSVVGPAPQGSTEGRTGRLPDGTRVRVTNGQLVVAE